MTATIRHRISTFLGWCPNVPGTNVETAGNRIGTEYPGYAGPASPQPGISPTAHPVHRWMTAGALAILFATFFVGGNSWWPAVVLAILVIFLIIHIRTTKATECA